MNGTPSPIIEIAFHLGYYTVLPEQDSENNSTKRLQVIKTSNQQGGFRCTDSNAETHKKHEKTNSTTPQNKH
jgi:hypothetical protein